VSRRGLATSLVTIVVVIVVVLGVLVATMSGSSHKVQQNTQASPTPAKSAPAPAPAPPPAPLTLVSSDQNGSVYNVTSNHLALSAVASGRVWLEVVAGAGPSGQVIFQGILTNGQSQQITNDAPVWIRIGAPGNVAMTVNGAGVLLPSQTSEPYNLTLST
jgi:pyruvate/2-oxoglutarate dehydrogenase complex dihydrolipoamide acyltransferase (E2) component